MANPWAGEVELWVDGRARTMRLTLGALAELEARLGTGSLTDLVGRFEKGGFSAADLLSLLVAGLRGGGWAISAEDLGAAEIDGGPVAAARAAGELLAVTFAPPAP